MVTLLDTSVVIAIERGQLVLDRTPLSTGESFVVSAVTVSELLQGVLRAREGIHRARREAFVEQFIRKFAVLPFDLVTARIHAQLGAGLAMQGVTLGAHDLLIAATAISVGGRVATRDLRSFPKIPGIEILAC